MVRNSPNRVGLALLIGVLPFVVALDKCRTGCNGAQGLLKLTPGTTYKYEYDGKINILLSSAEGQQTSTEVKSTVFLTQQADCSQVLRIGDIQVIGPDGKRTGIPDIEKPVVLNNNNGRLDEFICAEPGDTQNSLNIKRAIASLFQVNSEDKKSEIDVFGQCPTHVHKSQEGGVLTVTKNKNLNKCAFRESLTQNYISSSFNIHSAIQSSPILNSKFDSKQKIKEGVLISATVVENYLFVPFSVGQNGAKASIESTLTLKGTSKDNPSTKCHEPKSIIFEDPHPVNALKSNVNLILKKVKDISEHIALNVEDKTAIQFIDLVKLLRVSSKADILSVYNQVASGVGFGDKEGAKKIFLDAILLGGNGDTIEVAIELLKNKELGPLEEKQLYIGLSRARHVTANSINTASDLLNRPNLPREAFLGIGSLAGRYCDKHSCEDVSAVKNIIQKFLSKLGDLKAANRKEETDMIYVLKGLTNIGYLNDDIDSKLVSLAEDKKQPARLRVATLEAFQAAPCRDKLRNSALKTLKDIQQDSEIRIKAYLVLTGCPNDKIGNAIKALLQHEQSYQVGGFISTHIKNLRSSTNPDKANAKAHLGFIHTPSRFPIDPRKYSFNAEFSYSVDALGVANDVEGNVIYSQNSWLPRSSSLNLTAEVFGQRFNILEIAARQENLDRIIEHYLGPQGVLRKATLQQNWDNTVKPITNIFKNFKEKLDKSLRARRDVSKAQIDAINKKVQIKSNELDKNLDIDLSIKNFGTETVFLNSFEVTKNLSPQNIIDELVDKLNEGLNKLKNFEETFRSNILFLDAELSYPTSTGFPLRLGIEGASNIQIKTEGNIDVRQLFFKSSSEDINLKLSLIPSAAVTVTGRFSFDTPLLENGLKVASTLHTSSGGEVVINSFKKGYGLDVKVHFPVQHQELIGLTHDIIFQSRENGVSINDQKLKFSQNKDLAICIDQLVDYIGLEFCANINGPNLSGKKVPILPFPFSGDAKVSVRLERGEIDTFHYRREFFSSDGKIGVIAKVETLGPNNKKGVSLDVEGFLSPDKYIKAALTSPIKNAEAEARLITNPKEKLLSVYLKDESKIYSAKVGLTIDGTNDKTIYKPVFEYTAPGSNSPQVPPVRIEGKVIAEKNGNNIKYTFDNIKFIISEQKSVGLVGNVGNEGPAYFADVTASQGSLSASVKGRVQIQHDLLKLQTQFKNTMNPTFNFDLNGEFKHDKPAGLFSSSVRLIHGEDLNSKTNTLTLINSFTLKNPKEAEFSTKNKFSYPLIKVSAKFNLDRTLKSLNYDTYLHYGDVKLGSELKFKVNTKSVGDYQLEFDAHDAKNKLELKSSRQVIGSHDSKISNSLSMNGKKLEVSGKVKHFVKPNDLHLGADLVIKSPNSKNVWKLNKGIKFNAREIAHHLKLISGDKHLIDNAFHANRVGDASGHIKIHFKDALDIVGHLKAQKGVGNADILIDAKALKKSSKAEATFKIHKPYYNLHFTFYPVFHENKNKKVVFSTNNQYTGSKLDSKSSLDVLGTKFALNAKAALSNFFSGKTEVDVDLTLPEEKFFVGKFQREVSPKDNLWNSKNFLSVEQKNAKSSMVRKIVIKSDVKDTNFEGGVFDIKLNLDVKDPKGSALVDTALKRKKDGDKWKVHFDNQVISSSLERPIEIRFESEYKHLTGEFKLESSAAKNAKIEISGKHNFEGHKNQFSGEVEVEATLPCEALSSVKLSESIKLKLPEKNEQWLIESSGSLNTDSSNKNLDISSEHKFKIEGTVSSANLEYQGKTSKPFKINLETSGSYSIDKVKKIGDAKADFKAELSEGRTIKGNAVLSRLASKEYQFDSSLDFQNDQSKHHLKVQTKTTGHCDVSTQATYISNGKKYFLDSDLNLKEKEPKIDVKFTYPDGKVSQFFVDVKRPSDRRLSSNVKVNSQLRDFLLEGGLDINAESLENFSVKVDANSPKLNINDVVFKISSAPGGAGKHVNIDITSAKKNIISGSAVVSSREEQGKFIVEGSGNFKVENQDKSGNFKYISTSLTAGKNGETGEEISFDASLGNKAIDAELKWTDKEFRYTNSYCEESKQCAHVEVDIKNSIEGVSQFSNEIEVTIDLRVLGIPNEFGLKAVTRREDWILNHSVDLHFENAANKYQYSLYIHPKEAGISLTTPFRIIALEANGDLPTSNLRNGGKVSGEVAFYTDKKNKPNSKSYLKGFVDVDVEKRLVNAVFNLNVVGLSKPSTIKYSKSLPAPGLTSSGNQELILDIFAKPEHKFVISHKYSTHLSKENFEFQGDNSINIHSVGWGVDINLVENTSLNPKEFTGSYKDYASISFGNKKYDSVISADVSPKGTNILVKYLNRVLLEVKSDVKVQKGLINVDTHISGLFVKPVESTLEIKNYNSVKYVQKSRHTQNVQLLVNAAITPGKLAEAHAEYLNANDKKELFYVSVQLDDKHFLKPKIDVKTENLKEYTTLIHASVLEELNQTALLIKESNQGLVEDLQVVLSKTKDILPDVHATQEFYGSELNKIKAEFDSDKSLKEFEELVRNVVSTVASVLSNVINDISKIVESASISINAAFSKTLETIQKEIVPRLTKIAEDIKKVADSIYDEVSKVVLAYVAKAGEILKAIQPQLNAIASAFSEIFEEIGGFVHETYEKVRAAVIEHLKHLKAELESSSIYAELKTYYEEFIKNGLPSQEIIINTLKSITGVLKEAILIPEFQNVVDLVEKYLEKKITNKPVDDVAELELISKTLVDAISKFVTALSQEALPEFLHNIKIPKLNFDLLKRLPNGEGGLRISVLNYLLKEDTQPLARYILRQLWTPQDWLKSSIMTGALNSAQIITFDGRFLYPQGSCSYLVASDAVNGNFSVVATVGKGKLISVVLTDKHGSVSISENKILFNNAEVDYPFHKAGIHAYRHYTHTSVYSTLSGVEVECELTMLGCAVVVPRFYHGQLRGILGNGNNEPFDDFTLPNGKIVTSTAEFAKTYSIGPTDGCSILETSIESPSKPNEECEKLFGWDSPLKLCYPFLSHKEAKRACENAVAVGHEGAFHAVALHYAYYCWKLHIPISMPSDHSHPCTNSIAPKKVDESFNVKLPGKAADVVLLVSTNKNNEVIYKEYIKPLIGELVKEYKSKGINDVKFHLIAFAGENQQPAHVTVHGKMTFEGSPPNLKFAENPKSQKLLTGCVELNRFIDLLRTLIHDVKVTVGADLLADSYKETIEYPFRVEALRTAILVGNEPCEVSSLLGLHFGSYSSSKQRGVHLNVIMPVKHLKVKDAKTTKDVVGFNSNNVITLSDAKNKPLGSPALESELSFSNLCLDYIIGVGGNVFPTENFLANKNSRSQILQVVSKNIVSQALSKKVELQCSCEYSYKNPIQPYNHCKVLEIKDQ
ncbi:hypothetical protein WA026_002563 [Henosepilachna vigintioctopunctata]|uniref:Apolipophorin n=1 Tax=Henosepilachna vigintioctopunctata TaxID=420089 RepID=A0AAW1U0Q7_9CUCU